MTAFTKDDALELWREAEHAAAFAPYGTPCDEAAEQAAATVLHDSVEARLAEVRANVTIWQSKCQMEADERRREIADRDRTIAHLKARLERSDPDFDRDDLDGISCRNDTIKLQDERIERMTRTIAEQAAELHKAQAALFSAMRDLKANGLGYSRVQSAHDSIRAALQKDQTNG